MVPVWRALVPLGPEPYQHLLGGGAVRTGVKVVEGMEVLELQFAVVLLLAVV
jgi:hypothetical protein